jgi:protein gp37
MGDFWDNNISDGERFHILVTITANPQHRFLVLTKRPENIHPLIMKNITSGAQLTIEIPKNLWLGVTVDYPGTEKRIDTLIQNGDPLTENLFVSFEPLLGYISPNLQGIKWVIIGAQTNPDKQPDKKWVDEVLYCAGEHNLPVFMKNNLCPQSLCYYWARKHDYPEGLVL